SCAGVWAEPSVGSEASAGIEYTTFSLIGRCERTGMFGVAISTSEMAVGSRCIHVAPGVGAIVTQASTNPRLGHLGLNLLRAGYSAPRVLEEIAASDQFVERRQLGCLDVSGLAAARTGAENKPWAGHRVERNVVVAANMVAGPGVADAIPTGGRPPSGWPRGGARALARRKSRRASARRRETPAARPWRPARPYARPRDIHRREVCDGPRCFPRRSPRPSTREYRPRR